MGINGSEKDASISAFIPVAENIVMDILGIDDFLSHEIVGEKIEVNNPTRFFVKNFPINLSSLKVFDAYGKEQTTGFFQEFGAIRKINVGQRHAPEILHCGDYSADYSAGYTDANAVPRDIKSAISFVISSLLAEQETNGGAIESYTVYDVESVKFRETKNFQSVKNILKKYL